MSEKIADIPFFIKTFEELEDCAKLVRERGFQFLAAKKIPRGGHNYRFRILSQDYLWYIIWEYDFETVTLESHTKTRDLEKAKALFGGECGRT